MRDIKATLRITTVIRYLGTVVLQRAAVEYGMGNLQIMQLKCITKCSYSNKMLRNAPIRYLFSTCPTFWTYQNF